MTSAIPRLSRHIHECGLYYTVVGSLAEAEEQSVERKLRNMLELCGQMHGLSQEPFDMSVKW